MGSEQSKQPSKQMTEARAAAQRAKLNAQAAERRRTAEKTSKTKRANGKQGQRDLLTVSRTLLSELAPLVTLPAGTRATIVRLAEHDGDLLHWFYDQGLVPGTSILVRVAEPAAAQFTVSIEKVGERAISEKAAAGLFVRPA